MSDLITACKENDLKTVKKLLREGADINTVDKDGDTAFIDACMFNLVDIIRELLKFENIDVNIVNPRGWTGLMYVCHSNNIETFNELKNYNRIDYNIQDCYGWSALLIAACNSNKEIVEELLQIDTIDRYGIDDEGLKYAFNHNHYEIIKILKKRMCKNLSIIGLPLDITRLLVDYIGHDCGDCC